MNCPQSKLILTASIAALSAVIGALFVSALTAPKAAKADDNPQSYKGLYSEKCSACHNLPDPAVQQNTVDRWRVIVRNMAAKPGAVISDDDQGHIVEYLGLFPPKPSANSNDPLGVRPEDVFSTDPTQSSVYTFALASQLSAFTVVGGQWAVTASNDNSYVAQTHPLADTQGLAMLVQSKSPLNGEFNLQDAFSSDTGGRVTGIVFGYRDQRNYDAVFVDATKNQVGLAYVQNGQITTAQAAPAPDLANDPSGWHTLRVMYRSGQRPHVTVWIDSNKRLIAPLTGYTDGGQFGILTGGATTARFKSLIVDMYAAPDAGIIQ